MNGRRLWTLLLAGAIVVLTPATFAEEVITGQCVKVHDGDTIDVLTDEGVTTVHLDGVDAPEPKQRFAIEAHLHLVEHALAKDVTVRVVGVLEGTGEPVAAVAVGDHDLSRSLLRDGLAWCTREPEPSDELLGLEAAARQARKGLWVDASPISPWDWRAGVRQAAAPTPRPLSLAEAARSMSLATEDGGPVVIDDSQVSTAESSPGATRPGPQDASCCCAFVLHETTRYQRMKKLECTRLTLQGQRRGPDEERATGCAQSSHCE